jgi:uncharacterized membrane protein
MTQDEINKAEWENPDNWSDRFGCFYFSKKDSRIWVRKRPPWRGGTLNVAHPKGAYWCVAFMLMPFFVLLAMVLLANCAMRCYR